MGPIKRILRRFAGWIGIARHLNTPFEIGDGSLLPKGKLDIRVLGSETRMPEPLSPQYGSVAMDVAAELARRYRPKRGLLDRVFFLRDSIPRQLWQVQLLARAHAISRKLTLTRRGEGKGR